MRVLLVAPRGFCAGVNRAIESLNRAIDRFGTPIYVYHEIVHNRHIVEDFRARGVVFVDHIGEVPSGAVLLYSAHGVSPTVRNEAAGRKLLTIDATCPLVTKVHREAIRFAEKKYQIVLIGHRGHDEVVGTMGEAPQSILVTNLDEVDQLDFKPNEKIAYLTQTTLAGDEARAIIDRLRQRYPQIVGPSGQDICFATQNRQQAVLELAPEADLGLVVGSQNSSNSRRLTELCRSVGVEAFLVDGPSEINPHWFAGGETVLLTAGASAPEQLVRQCVDLLAERFDAMIEERIICEENLSFSLPKELISE
jgi:4-hydroxy-3-methylbut-2-en-1-yl diphosphate reductase